MTTKPIAFNALAIVLTLLFSQALFADDASEPVETTPIRVGTPSGFGGALISIALEHGYFQQAGLYVAVTQYDYGKQALDALLGGKVDLAVATDFVLLHMLAGGERRIKVLGAMAVARDIQLIFAPAAKVSGLTDIQGKRIGVPPGSNVEYFLSRLSVLHGLDESRFNVVPAAPAALPRLFASGELDGAMVWEPHITRLKNSLGAEAKVFDGQPGEDYYLLLFAHADWVHLHHRQAERLLSAIKRAEKWLYANETEGRRYLSRKLALQEADVERIWSRVHHFFFLPQSLVVSLQSQAEWLQRERGVALSRSSSYIDVLHAGPLLSVEPAAVSLAR